MKFHKKHIYKKHGHILPNWSKERLMFYFVITAIVATMITLSAKDGQMYRTSLITAQGAKRIFSTAQRYLGYPYVFGAEGPRAYDCSSFVQKIFKDALDYENMPRLSRDQAKKGMYVDRNNAIPGDLLFYDTLGKGYVTHVGIYGGEVKGKPMLLHANSVSEKVVFEPISGKYWSNVYETTRRINDLTFDMEDDRNGNNNNNDDEVIPLPPSEPEPEDLEEKKNDNKNSSSNVTFTDVDNSYPFKDAIYALANQGIIKGIGDDKFGPYMYLTRAELLKLLLTTFKTSQMGSKTDFSDLKNHWVKKYVATALKKGWIKGYNDGTFRPNQTVTRAEGTKIALEVSGLIDKYNYTENFSDVPADSWQEPYASIAKKKKLLSFNGNKFDPNLGLTRGEAAYLIYETKNTR